jgi:hypothetical protein
VKAGACYLIKEKGRPLAVQARPIAGFIAAPRSRLHGQGTLACALSALPQVAMASGHTYHADNQLAI